ncbi:Glutaredoxin [Arthrobacter alpinus]|uniref:Glutaredoxin n=1 Tax=Arthrobacter alpinus TaxID=656366 RepID=A0A1H5PF93_9MICC|nr:Glutaredoxin [Arthrobacter alpinus]
MISFTIYTKPDCPNCEKTKDYFDRKGILYGTVDVTEVREAMVFITEELGYSQAPVIVNGSDPEDHWSGLRLDKLVQANINHLKALAAMSFEDENGDFDYEVHHLATQSREIAASHEPAAIA